MNNLFIYVIYSLVLFSCIAGITNGSRNGGDLTRKIPTFLRVCSRSDDYLEECVKSTIEKLRPYLVAGVPDAGIPQAEPLKIPKYTIYQKEGPLKIRLAFTNVEVSGMSRFNIRSIEIDPIYGKVRVLLVYPYIHMYSYYNLDGVILTMPVHGKGSYEAFFTENRVNVQAEFERFVKDEQVYLNVRDVKISFKVGRASLNFEGLFNGDKELGDNLNLFVNRNWESIIKELKPSLQESMSESLKTIVNNVFHKYPFDMILPP